MHPSKAPIRVLIIGAGSRGHTYASAIHFCTQGSVVGVAEPQEWKRNDFVRRYGIARDSPLVFSTWEGLLEHREVVEREVDGICVCTLDETHAEIVTSLRPLNLHILCEKPLATTLEDVRSMYASVVSTEGTNKPILFAIGHVLRYSPHNHLLHKLLVDDAVLGDIVNVNHTEPVGYWHFAHSYVRGNWRNSSTTAPSLLTKCCHDVDLLLWLLSSPTGHLPTHISSTGSLVHFTRSRKPKAAGEATNCLSCVHEPDCIYSAKRIYVEHNLKTRQSTGWPNKIVAPEIEDAPNMAAAESLLAQRLAEDFDVSTSKEKRDGRGWYGRCVWESDNDVVDNQVVLISFDPTEQPGQHAKTATLTMIAHTEKICERFTKVYGTLGELTADSRTITVFDFRSGEKTEYTPEMGSGHGGGDVGLAAAFIDAIRAVLDGVPVEEAQRKCIKCTPEEAVRAHEVVFWAEAAREERRVIDGQEWGTRSGRG